MLRPGGALATLGNGRDLSDPLQQAIQEIVGPYLPAAGEILAGSRSSTRARSSAPWRSSRTTHEQLFDADGLAERMGTVSYVARLPDGDGRTCWRGSGRSARRSLSRRSRSGTGRRRESATLLIS